MDSVRMISNKGPYLLLNTLGKIGKTNSSFGYTYSTNTYSWTKKMVVKGNRLYLFKPGSVHLPFINVSNINSAIDSIRISGSEPLVDVEADTNSTNPIVYGLCKSGMVYAVNTASTGFQTYNVPSPIKAKKLALSKRVNTIPIKVGVLDSLGRIFVSEINGSQLVEITTNLNKPIIDFDISGDSIFALGNNNVLYIAHWGSTITWQKDSIHCNRTLKGLSAFNAYYVVPGRYSESNWGYPLVLLYGSGNSVIATGNTTLWPIPNEIKSKLVNNLSIYPNPVTNRTFRTNVEGINNVQLFDIQGRNLATLPATEGDNQTFEIPSSIKPGYYVLKGMLKGQLYVGKVVVQ